MKQKPQESVMGDSVAASTLVMPAAAPTTAASTISYQDGDKAQEQCTSKKVGSKRHDKDPLPNPNFQTEVPLERWTVKEFLVAKQEHKYKTGVEKSRFAGARGLPSSLQVMYDKIMQKGIDISDVDTDIPAFIQELRAHEKKVVSLFDKAQNVKKEAFHEEKETLNDIRTTSDALEKKYDELVDGLKTKLNIANGEGRSQTSKDQWQGQKISAHFQRGQHTEGVSNHWGRTIASFNKAVGAGVEREPLSNDAGQWKVALPTPQPQLNPNIKSFDADKIALFFDEWGETAEGQAFFVSIDDYVRVKEQKMTTQMTDNSKWKGCQGPLDIPGLSEDIFDIFKDNVSNMDGAKPILYLFRNNHRRFASDIAFATCSALYHNVCGNTLWVLTVPLQSLLKIGISIVACERFFDTADGFKFLAKESVATPLLPNHTTYIPQGEVMWITSHEGMDKKTLGLSSFVQLPLCGSVVTKAKLEPSTFDSIKSFNLEHLKAKAASSQTWQERFDFFKSTFKLD